MKRLITFSLGVISGLCMIVAMEGRAWGYVDPGSGLVALQTVASVGAACSWFMRKRLQSLFGSKEDAQDAKSQVSGADSKDNLQDAA